MRSMLNGILSEYYPFPEKFEGLQELCTGMQMRNPIFWFDNDRFVISADIVKEPYKMRGHCESYQYQI